MLFQIGFTLENNLLVMIKANGAQTVGCTFRSNASLIRYEVDESGLAFVADLTQTEILGSYLAIQFQEG